MARIAIVKLRPLHDAGGGSPKMTAVSRWLGRGVGDLQGILEAFAGGAYVSQLTPLLWVALGEAYNAQEGRAHTFELFDDCAERLHLSGYDMVWLSSTTATVEATYRLADQLRHGGSLVVMGGPHVAALPEEAAGHADALLFGDEARAIPALLADYEGHGHLASRYDGGHEAPLSLPSPLPWERLSEGARRALAFVAVEAKRGREDAVTPSLTPAIEGAFRRHRPISAIVEEIRALQDRGVLTSDKVLFFADDDIVAGEEAHRGLHESTDAKKLFEALIPLDLQWAGKGSINVADDGELVELMARSGCVQLQVGLDSLSRDNLAVLGKTRQDPSRYLQQVDRLARYGISLIARMKVGFDGDGPGVFEEIARFIDAGIDIPQLSLLTPLPGTSLFHQMKRAGRLLHEEWSLYDGHHVVFHPREMSPHQLEDGYRWLMVHSFRYAAILKRALRAATRALVYARPQMTFRARIARTLAPNLAFRSLAQVERVEALVTTWDPSIAPQAARA